MQDRIVFVPDMSTADNASIWALAVLALLCLLLGAVIARNAARRSRMAFVSSGLAMLFTVGALGAVLAERIPQLSRVTFSDDELIVQGVGSTTRLPFNHANRVNSDGGAIFLQSGNKSVSLPEFGSWRLDNLVVNAKYLANEFRGRSAYR